MDSKKPLKAKRKKRCKNCKEWFEPFNSMTVACSPKCAIALAPGISKKRYNEETKELKSKAKKLSDWLREAQASFNAYIRARDKGKPCCSCDKPDNGQHQRHASHYRSVGACSQLRFNTFNVHASCATCNSVLSGNLIEYRIRLVKKLGQNRVDWLESQNELVRYDIEYLAKLKKVFNKRTRRELHKNK